MAFRSSREGRGAALRRWWGWTLALAAVATACGTVTVDSGGMASGSSANGGGESFGPATAGDASACQPGSVETFVPAPYQHASGAWQGVCVDDGVDLSGQYYQACFAPSATPAACDAFKTSSQAAAACAACILTPSTATRLGPIIDYGGYVAKNTAGCLELTQPDGLPCATAVQALTGCERSACGANCPVTSAASLDDYYVCADAADTGGCATFADMAQCEYASDGGAASICTAASFEDFYDAVVPLFCGQPGTLATDAGTTLFAPLGDAGAVDAGDAGDAAGPADAASGDAAGDAGGVDARAD